MLNLVKNVTRQVQAIHPDLPIFWIQVSPDPRTLGRLGPDQCRQRASSTVL
ncbi:hypothetical protein [Spirosoma sp.]|uniref:hypothetical protein n=1 Tax=Spirosoma sp. TaxID=1899569 RepID=UPI002630EB53|nr:hypothetical protein [Spirosoma sp.]MCX6218731.1 hypothetical protein [Spirosoma sp.]